MNKKSIGFLLAGLLLLPGCLNVPRYKSQSLQTLPNNFTYWGMEDNVVLQSKRLTVEEIEHLFGVRAEHLLPSVEIIHCSIHNLSRKNYIFSAQNQDFTSLSVHQVTRLIKTSSTGRIATGIFGGIGISAVSNGAVIGAAAVLIPALSVAVPYAVIFGLPLMAIVGGLPFYGKAIKSMVMNHRINKDLQNKMITTDVIIKSGDKYEGLIFVKTADYSPQFNLTMHEKWNVQNSITFEVDLR